MKLEPIHSILIGLLLVSPFIIGEFLTSPKSPELPIPLFLFMWIISALFVLLGGSVFQDLKRKKRNEIKVTLKIICMGIIVWSFTEIVIDQWPCFFLGGTGC